MTALCREPYRVHLVLSAAQDASHAPVSTNTFEHSILVKKNTSRNAKQHIIHTSFPFPLLAVRVLRPCPTSHIFASSSSLHISPCNLRRASQAPLGLQLVVLLFLVLQRNHEQQYNGLKLMNIPHDVHATTDLLDALFCAEIPQSRGPKRRGPPILGASK
jgi:hypothetical protein